MHRGETYYAGDNLNKALISPEEVEDALADHPKAAADATLAETAAAAPTKTDPLQKSSTSAAKAAASDASAVFTDTATGADGDAIKDLIDLASGADKLQSVQSIAAERLLKYDGEVYPRDGCAITLSVLLQSAGINIPDTFQALALGNLLKKRGWKVIPLGSQQKGDVGSTCGKVAQHGRITSIL